MAASLVIVSIIGFIVLWDTRESVKVFVFALLLICVFFLTFCQFGLPRPSWIFGVPTGRLISYQLDEGHGLIHLWIAPQQSKSNGRSGPPVSVDIPFSEKGASALEQAERQAGRNGQVMIGPNTLQKGGNNKSEGNSPFNNIPFVPYAQTWHQLPPKTPLLKQ